MTPTPSAVEFPPIPTAELTRFCEGVGHRFNDPRLLGQALTHRSWCAEHAGFDSNERLEFLGDAVLGMVVTEEVFTALPDAGEGHLSRVRASVVCAPALAEMAVELDIGSVLLLGKGERASGGAERPSILADAMEAVIGAVFLDGGMEPAADLVLRLVRPRLAVSGAIDHKSRLHELAAGGDGRQISYEVTEAGPEHDKRFAVTVLIDGRRYGEGVGRSKKQAEQAAARQTWLLLDEERGGDPAREEATHG